MGTGTYTATSNNMKLVQLAVDVWDGTFGTARRKVGGAAARPGAAQAPPCCTKCNSPPINGQCTNHRIAV